MHRTVVYPNGMVEVFTDDEDLDLGEEIEEVEEAEDDEDIQVSDALSLLENHFQHHGAARVALETVRATHNAAVWAKDAQPSHNFGVIGDPPSMYLGEAAMLRG